MTAAKSIVLVVLAGLLGAGCIPGGVGPRASFAGSRSWQTSPGASFDDSASSQTDPGASFDDSSGASFDDSSSSQSSGPQVVIPATGGAPEVATPVGGDMYIPVTGGPPIVGIGT
jgi:hypothetical protein